MGAAQSVQLDPLELPAPSVRALKQRIHSLLSSQHSLQLQNQSLAAERLAFQNERDQQTNQYQVISAERDALQAERDSLNDHLQKLTAQRDSIQQQLERQQSIVADLQRQLNAQSAHPSEQIQQSENLQARMENLQRQLNGQSTHMTDMICQPETVQTRMEGLQFNHIQHQKGPVDPRDNLPALTAYDWNELGLETDGQKWNRGSLSTKDLFSLIADERSPQGFFLAKRNRPSELCMLFDFYGSDKGSNSDSGLHIYGHMPHSYGEVYEHLFHGRRGEEINLLECGVGSANPEIPSNMGLDASPGASLRAWRDYFPNARIYGCDIDRACLVNEERIASCYVDQLQGDSILQMWEHFGKPLFDVIIDDGLHTAKAALSLLQGSYSFLSNVGLYIIEDITPVELIKINEFLCMSRINYTLYSGLRRQEPDSSPAIDDNTIIVIRAQDIPKSFACRGE